MPDVRLSLASARLSAGLSQSAIGDLIDAGQAHVSKIERAHSTTTLEKAAIWADACGYDLTVIPRAAPGAGELAAELAGLSADQRSLLRRLAQVMQQLDVPRQRMVEHYVSMLEGDVARETAPAAKRAGAG